MRNVPLLAKFGYVSRDTSPINGPIMAEVSLKTQPH